MKKSKITECKACGTPIAGNAKVCPSCGAKIKKPFYKNGLFIIIAVIVVREVLIGDNGVQERENWDRFVKDSSGKKETSIRLRYQYSGTAADKLSFMPESTEAYLSYDGENYWYNDGGKNTAYRYLLKLSGRNPNAEKSTTMWILANEKYTFDQISKSWYSNDSRDHISYELIYSV